MVRQIVVQVVCIVLVPIVHVTLAWMYKVAHEFQVESLLHRAVAQLSLQIYHWTVHSLLRSHIAVLVRQKQLVVTLLCSYLRAVSNHARQDLLLLI